MAFWIPTGFDRADGVTALPSQPKGSSAGNRTSGTPNPYGQMLTLGENGQVEEEVDSPEIERAEQATFQHRLKASWDTCVNLITFLGRGTFLKDSFGNTWRVLSSKIQSARGGRGTLSVTAESISFDNPPDDFQMIPVDLGIDILKHPRYSWALSPTAEDSGISTVVGDTTIYYSDIKESIIRMIQSYRDAPQFPSAQYVNGLIQSNILSQIKNGKIQIHYPNSSYNPGATPLTPLPWDGVTAHKPAGNMPFYLIGIPVSSSPNDAINIAIAAAKEVISKLWKQEDNPYVVGFQLTWTQYFFAPVYLNPGGYQENPWGIVPAYFLSPSQDGSNSIFDNIAYINPQCYSNDRTTGGSLSISWLRKSDEIEYQRTWFKVTHTWIGSPIGHWDNDLFKGLGQNGPQNASWFNIPVY